jgi:hypothetical protein
MTSILREMDKDYLEDKEQLIEDRDSEYSEEAKTLLRAYVSE